MSLPEMGRGTFPVKEKSRGIGQIPLFKESLTLSHQIPLSPNDLEPQNPENAP